MYATVIKVTVVSVDVGGILPGMVRIVPCCWGNSTAPDASYPGPSGPPCNLTTTGSTSVKGPGWAELRAPPAG